MSAAAMLERNALVWQAEQKLLAIARLKPGWNGTLTRREARLLLDELQRLRNQNLRSGRDTT